MRSVSGGSRGGVASRYTNEQFEAALRHGVGPDKRGLLFMPSQEFQYLSDEDAAALGRDVEAMAEVARNGLRLLRSLGESEVSGGDRARRHRGHRRRQPDGQRRRQQRRSQRRQWQRYIRFRSRFRPRHDKRVRR